MFGAGVQIQGLGADQRLGFWHGARVGSGIEFRSEPWAKAKFTARNYGQGSARDMVRVDRGETIKEGTCSFGAGSGQG
eukprot:6631754-Pyramimonas_sp.AAC.1